MGIQTSLDAAARRPTASSTRCGSPTTSRSRAAATRGVRTIRVLHARPCTTDDQLAAIAATHALAQIFDDEAVARSSALLSDDRRLPARARRVGARLAAAPPRRGRRVSSAWSASGGFGGMLAQRTLEQWSPARPSTSPSASRAPCSACAEPAARATALVETLGLVRGTRSPPRPLLALAADAGRGRAGARRRRRGARPAPRRHRGRRRCSTALAVGDDVPRRRRAARARRPRRRRAPSAPRAARDATGLTVAQLFLHADIDAELSAAGSGDNGGIATLLVRLGDALVAGDPRSRRGRASLTLSRGSVAGALGRPSPRSPPTTRAPLRAHPAAERARAVGRGLAAAGGRPSRHPPRCCGPPAASTCCTCAWPTSAASPPPMWRASSTSPWCSRSRPTRTPSSSRSTSPARSPGELRRRSTRASTSGSAPAWCSGSPRTPPTPCCSRGPSSRRDMRELVGIDITAHPERHTIVPEGIDLGVVDRAVAEARAHARGRRAVRRRSPSCAPCVEALPERAPRRCRSS